MEIDGKTVASHLSLDDNEYGEPSADPTPQNDQNAYHYSRAEIWYNGSSVVAATPHYGYGKVYTTSPCTPRKGTARIFYGE